MFRDIFPNHILTVDGKRAHCGPTGSLSYEIQATPMLKILGMSCQLLIALQRQKTEKGPTNVVPKDLAGGVPKVLLSQKCFGGRVGPLQSVNQTRLVQYQGMLEVLKLIQIKK